MLSLKCIANKKEIDRKGYQVTLKVYVIIIAMKETRDCACDITERQIDVILFLFN